MRVCMCLCVRVMGGWRGGGDDKQHAHARMVVVYSNIQTEFTAQVKGSAKMMVTVVTTKDLEAGDVLRRFKAKAAQDGPRRGNDYNRYISSCQCLEVAPAHGISPHLYVVSFFFFSFVHVCV